MTTFNYVTLENVNTYVGPFVLKSEKLSWHMYRKQSCVVLYHFLAVHKIYEYIPVLAAWCELQHLIINRLEPNLVTKLQSQKIVHRFVDSKYYS